MAEARRRFPHIPFEQGDIEERNILQLGGFDLVLCFGVLYHLENPLLAIRNLRGLTKKCLLLENMCLPGEKPSMLVREEPRQEGSEPYRCGLLFERGRPRENAVPRRVRDGLSRNAVAGPRGFFAKQRSTSDAAPFLLASTAPIDVA